MTSYIELDVIRFLVCSKEGTIVFAKPDDDYQAAVALCAKKRRERPSKIWAVVAELKT